MNISLVELFFCVSERIWYIFFSAPTLYQLLITLAPAGSSNRLETNVFFLEYEKEITKKRSKGTHWMHDVLMTICLLRFYYTDSQINKLK